VLLPGDEPVAVRVGVGEHREQGLALAQLRIERRQVTVVLPPQRGVDEPLYGAGISLSLLLLLLLLLMLLLGRPRFLRRLCQMR
jgi:hypothetical protein